MFGGNQNNDKALQKSVTQRLLRASSQAGLSASVQNGSVTLTGKLHFENQRSPIVKAMRSVAGIRSVIDQMVSPPKVRPMHAQNNYRPPTPDVDAVPLAIFDPDAASPAPEISDPPGRKPKLADRPNAPIRTDNSARYHIIDRWNLQQHRQAKSVWDRIASFAALGIPHQRSPTFAARVFRN